MLEVFPKSVRIVEVGPRDGLQNEKKIISTENKLTYIKMLIDAGARDIEITSFVNPKKVLQMSDGKELFLAISKLNFSGQFYALVPNEIGLNDALLSGVKSVAVFTSISEIFNQKNINASIKDSLLRIEKVAKVAHLHQLKIRGYISCAFGCPYIGDTSVDDFIHVALELKKMGVSEISIGDTIGVAHPLQVKKFLEKVLAIFPKEFLAMHFHDTRGMAMANILTSLDYGIENFDSSSGGLGGCPYALGATGNVETEKLVYMFQSMGIETGFDLLKLKAASAFIKSKLAENC